jgi:hypothetical protein
MLGRPDDGWPRFEAALERARATGSGHLVARFLCNLASAAHALGRSEDARDGFLRALQAAGTEASPLTLEILLGLAGPLARLGEAALAAGLAGFVAGHSATQDGRRQAATRLLERLRQWLSADELERCAARWRAASLAAVVVEIQGEISRVSSGGGTRGSPDASPSAGQGCRPADTARSENSTSL